jgi:hypothetical protein
LSDTSVKPKKKGELSPKHKEFLKGTFIDGVTNKIHIKFPKLKRGQSAKK